MYTAEVNVKEVAGVNVVVLLYVWLALKGFLGAENILSLFYMSESNTMKSMKLILNHRFVS